MDLNRQVHYYFQVVGFENKREESLSFRGFERKEKKRGDRAFNKTKEWYQNAMLEGLCEEGCERT
jgi:hypothetical protein